MSRAAWPRRGPKMLPPAKALPGRITASGPHWRCAGEGRGAGRVTAPAIMKGESSSMATVRTLQECTPSDPSGAAARAWRAISRYIIVERSRMAFSSNWRLETSPLPAATCPPNLPTPSVSMVSYTDSILLAVDQEGICAIVFHLIVLFQFSLQLVWRHEYTSIAALGAADVYSGCRHASMWRPVYTTGQRKSCPSTWVDMVMVK